MNEKNEKKKSYYSVGIYEYIIVYKIIITVVVRVLSTLCTLLVPGVFRIQIPDVQLRQMGETRHTESTLLIRHYSNFVNN